MALRKIVSGGQTGADRGALDAAIEVGLPHGGWVPKGRLAEDGRIPDTYSLQEMPTDSYPARTEQNVKDSDGTTIISHGSLAGGSKLTQDLARKHKRPCLHIDINRTPQFLAATKINEWVTENRIEVLNVAGSRASEDPRIYDDTRHVMESAMLLGMVATDPRGYVRESAGGETFGGLPVPPGTVDEAVDRLIGRMTVKDRVTIANMGIDELVALHRSLGRYIRDTFRLPHNRELMASCRFVSAEPITDEDEAVSVIIGALRRELYETHRLRVVESNDT